MGDSLRRSCLMPSVRLWGRTQRRDRRTRDEAGGRTEGKFEARRAARNSFGVSSEWHNPETRARTERAGPALSRAARLWLLREERGAGRWARGVRIGRR